MAKGKKVQKEREAKIRRRREMAEAGQIGRGNSPYARKAKAQNRGNFSRRSPFRDGGEATDAVAD